MDRTSDLHTALEFVTGRIEHAAERSGEPLDEEQRYLLNNLPRNSPLPYVVTGEPESLPPPIIPRDANYERLIAATKAAHRNDLELNPASLDWDFAFAVLKLNRHPMSWLLQWAEVKQRRPWWDRWLLIIAAVLFIILTTALMFFVMGERTSLFRWALVGIGYLAAILIAYFVSRRIEERQLENNIEKFRRLSQSAVRL